MLLFFMNYFIVAVTAFVTAFTVSNCIHYSPDMKSPAALLKENKSGARSTTLTEDMAWTKTQFSGSDAEDALAG